MYWKENIWKAENSFSSSIKTNWIGELRSFSWFAEEPTKTFTSLICFWSFSDDETLALLIRFWWLAEERPCWLVDLENSQTNKMLTFLAFLMICRRGNTKLGIDLVGLQGCTNRCSLAAGLRGNGERMRKWRGNGEEMEREWGNGEKISSLFLY